MASAEVLLRAPHQDTKTVNDMNIDAIKDNLKSVGSSGINNAASALAELDASKLSYTYTSSPRPVPTPNSPEVWQAGHASDHMITCRWTAASGWDAPELKPYGPLSLLPAASVLHYATECFEGMKIFRGHDGALRLFRPDRNVQRMLSSALRIALPAFPPDELLKLIDALAAVDGPKWAPKTRPGTFFYVRPTLIGTTPTVNVKKPDEALLYVFMCAIPLPLDPKPAVNGLTNGHKPKAGIRLYASLEDTIRAWPGGFGNAKVGANYGPSLLASTEAEKKGYDQILWLFGQEEWVTEAGASNFFAVLKNDAGKKQLITASLEDRVILPGVNRASVLELARKNFADEGLEVVERRIAMWELVEAAAEGRLVEAFAAGTVYFITTVEEIFYRGASIHIPVPEEGKGVAGRIAAMMKEIQYGPGRHPWGYVINERE